MILLGGIAALFQGIAQAETIGIAATVNEGVITTTDVAERRNLILGSSGIPVTPETSERVTPRVLQSLIDETLQLQEAKRQSITITQEDVDKALGDLPVSKNQSPESFKKQLEAHGLSARSLENQVRAQLAWNKVVQRKLRRNVIISQDELIRAQQSEANAPDIRELHLTALILPVPAPNKEAATQALAQEIGAALRAGQDLATVAQKYKGRTEVKFNPPVWVLEENLPPEAQQALHNLKPGTTTPLLRTGTTLQYITLLERRTTKKPAASTEVTIKQITVEVPPKPDHAALLKLAESEQILRNNPGSCEDTVLTPTPLPASAVFARLTMGSLTPEQRSIVARLDVGALSEPLVANDKMRLVLLCERSESSGTAKDLENLRQQLFAEKMDLEAQKHLRNLRREASIDIRGEK